MNITAKLFANLMQYSPNPGSSGLPFSYELGDGATLADLVSALKLPDDQVKILFVNGIICDMDKILHEGDVIGIFPPVGGG